LKYVETRHAQLQQSLEQKKEMTDDIEKQLKDALADFKGKVWQK